MTIPASIDALVASYSRDRPRFENLARYVCGIIEAHSGSDLIHAAEHRAKSVDSFKTKCGKKNPDGSLKYPVPRDHITDLAGVRIIVFLRDSVDLVCQRVREMFEVVEFEDVGERVYLAGKFGYQSKHILIRLGTDRRDLVENRDIAGLVCEVQVRTILQHAWAEMEHDIQYKSTVDIPLDLNKRFSALAGLLEIADREFESIQRDSMALRNAVRVELVADLTQEALSKPDNTQKSQGDQNAFRAARDLVNQGLYQEAIEVYTRKIDEQPSAHTLYIGRAKAFFLAGDVRSAISDLDRSDELNPSAADAKRLRAIIENGDRTVINFSEGAKGNLNTHVATSYLSAGNGLGAFEEYSNLESSGFNKAFSVFGKAISCILEGDMDGAATFLDQLEVRISTPMSVNILAARRIIEIIRVNPPVSEPQLNHALSKFPDYSFRYSPLANLHEGLVVRLGKEHEACRFLSQMSSLSGQAKLAH